jgi:hypothetical protein
MEYIFPVFWRDTDEETVISKILGSYSGADEYSSLLGCHTMSTAKKLPTHNLQGNMV